MNKFKLWLMKRYCPEYQEKMPTEDDDNHYEAVAYVVWGSLGQCQREVACKRVVGLRNAYIEARWLALKAHFVRPGWLFDCGISYGVRKV